MKPFFETDNHFENPFFIATVVDNISAINPAEQYPTVLPITPTIIAPKVAAQAVTLS